MYNVNNNDTVSKRKYVEIMQQYATLERKYYEQLNKVKSTEDTDNNLQETFDIIQSFSAEIEQLANYILGVNSANLSDETLDVKEGVTYIDDSILHYVLDNSDRLKRKKVIREFSTCTVNCLICDKVIKGIGLLDWNDAGTNAICFKCIDSNVYVGDGIYFTNFV